ncbi:hypothetical protein QL285_077845 [Trifolium repens]|nr:hypothetical protein QL285_077845 [Trifolium repens]
MSTHPCKTIKFSHIRTVFYFNRLNIPSQLSRLIPRLESSSTNIWTTKLYFKNFNRLAFSNPDLNNKIMTSKITMSASFYRDFPQYQELLILNNTSNLNWR